MTNLTSVRGLLFFELQEELWRTDGTEAGTFRLGAAPAEVLAATNNRVLFSAPREGESNEYVWISDGSTENTFTLTIDDQVFHGQCWNLAGGLAARDLEDRRHRALQTLGRVLRTGSNRKLFSSLVPSRPFRALTPPR